jgi:hypothetical protein
VDAVIVQVRLVRLQTDGAGRSVVHHVSAMHIEFCVAALLYAPAQSSCRCGCRQQVPDSGRVVVQTVVKAVVQLCRIRLHTTIRQLACMHADRDTNKHGAVVPWLQSVW